jgi:hypothetical protein
VLERDIDIAAGKSLSEVVDDAISALTQSRGVDKKFSDVYGRFIVLSNQGENTLFRFRAVLNALTETLAGKPEHGKSPHLGRKIPFKHFGEWLYDLWANSWEERLKLISDQIENRIDYSSFADLHQFPGGSLEALFDELFRNISKHSKVNGTVVIIVNYNVQTRIMTIDIDNEVRPEQNTQSTKAGLRVIDKVLKANFGTIDSNRNSKKVNGHWYSYYALDFNKYDAQVDKDSSEK